MFKLTYKTDEGMVEATFKTSKELEAFQASMKKKNADRERRAKAREIAEAQKHHAEKEAEYAEFKRRNDEIRTELGKVALKAQKYGMTPERFVDILTATLSDLVEKGESGERVVMPPLSGKGPVPMNRCVISRA